LLVTPHTLPPYMLGAVIGAAVLIFVARPVAVFGCLLPFGFTLCETAFASWVGLRGAVPIYLSIIPALADPTRDQRLFASIFILVIASLVCRAGRLPRQQICSALDAEVSRILDSASHPDGRYWPASRSRALSARNAISAGVDSRPRISLRCGKRPKRSMTSR